MASDPLSALISGVFDLGGAGLTAGLGFAANKKQYKYQARLMKQQQRWMERMANTAHQREVSDLRSAGLNPILSATGGNGAATPTAGLGQVGQASMPDLSDLGSNIIGAAATAKNAKTAADAQKSQADLNESQANLNKANTALANAKTARELNIGKPLNKGGQLFDALADPDTYKSLWNKTKEYFGGSSSAKSSGDKTQKLRNVFKDGVPIPYADRPAGPMMFKNEWEGSDVYYGSYWKDGKKHKGYYEYKTKR